MEMRIKYYYIEYSASKCDDCNDIDCDDCNRNRVANERFKQYRVKEGITTNNKWSIKQIILIPKKKHKRSVIEEMEIIKEILEIIGFGTICVAFVLYLFFTLCYLLIKEQ